MNSYRLRHCTAIILYQRRGGISCDCRRRNPWTATFPVCWRAGAEIGGRMVGQSGRPARRHDEGRHARRLPPLREGGRRQGGSARDQRWARSPLSADDSIGTPSPASARTDAPVPQRLPPWQDATGERDRRVLRQPPGLAEAPASRSPGCNFRGALLPCRLPVPPNRWQIPSRWPACIGAANL